MSGAMATRDYSRRRLGFPEETAYALISQSQNFDFLEEYRDNIVAIVLSRTRGSPGRASFHPRGYNVRLLFALTAGLAESKLEEHDDR